QQQQQQQQQQQALYTYTIVTTDSNRQLRFLHDRMPAILEPGSEALWTWLDPGRAEWSGELQAVLRPFEGELEVYPVSKDVGKKGKKAKAEEVEVKKEEGEEAEIKTATAEELQQAADDGGMDTPKKGIKREAESPPVLSKAEPPAKKAFFANRQGSPVKEKAQTRPKISATSNARRSPVKSKAKAAAGTQKITKFFGNSA
ncbi:hypothetical protein VTH06DRAFT_7366, partial [Thermothelomyces fergusii]